MSDLQALRERVQMLKENAQKLEGRKATAEEEVAKIRIEIEEAGFKDVKSLKADITKAEAQQEKYEHELKELLGDDI